MAKLITLFKLLPKAHQITLSLLIIFTTIILIYPSDDSPASKHTSSTPETSDENDIIPERPRIQVPLAYRTPSAPSTDIERNARSEKFEVENAPENKALIKKPAEPAPSDDKNIEYYEVAKGDTLGGLFNRAGLTAKDVYDITLLPIAKKNLLTILPGEEIAISKNESGELTELSYRMDKISTLVISRQNDKYLETVNKKEINFESSFISGTINSSFWSAAANAGMSANHIMQFANIFGWDVDFALDIRKGDSFSLIIEQEFADGQFIRNGNILAAEFINGGERFTAVRYKDGEYYSESGNSMRKAFLRSPVDFKYVSSNFNPRRLHPVTGQIRAHRGVDYVAAMGTPIKAAGEGKVIESSYNQFNGNYVFIRHNDTYTTKYLHLTKRNVKRGDTVKQSQIIGTLGRTGRVTGAHLHYEFIVNGVHRDPRNVKLPKSMPINRNERSRFDMLSKQMMAQLKSEQRQQLASN